MSGRSSQPAPEPLPRRPLGGSPVLVTELSFGGAAIGNLYAEVSDESARAAIDAAWEGGIRTFDTAPHYGLGLSERRLGEALRHRPREEYVICTKVGRLLDPAAERAALEARQPMGRLVSAQEVAAGIAYLASPLAASVTGTALAIDGGMAGLRLRPRS